MSNKNPPGWVDSIYQIKTTDRVQGGPNGVINAAPAQLAQRTEALKGGFAFATTLSGDDSQFVGTFADGFTLTNDSQALSHSDGNFYVWHGQFDKVVPPGSTPETTGGIGGDAWVDIRNLTLRKEIKSSSGASIVGLTRGNVASVILETKYNRIGSFSDGGVISNSRDAYLFSDGYYYSYKSIIPTGGVVVNQHSEPDDNWICVGLGTMLIDRHTLYDFGCVSDNGVTDNRVNIQRAIEYMEQYKSTLYMDSNTDTEFFGVNSLHPFYSEGYALVIRRPRNVQIVGGRNRNSSIKYTGSAPGMAMIALVAGQSDWGLSIESLGVSAGNRLNHVLYAVDVWYANGSIIGGCYENAVLDGIHVSFYMTTFLRVFSNNNGRDGFSFGGPLTDGGFSGGTSTSLSLNNCWSRGSARYGYNVSNQLWYSNWSSLGCDGLPGQKTEIAYHFYSVKGCTLNSIGAEACVKVMKCDSFRGMDVSGIQLSNVGPESGVADYCIELVSGFDATFSGFAPVNQFDTKYLYHLFVSAATGNESVVILDHSFRSNMVGAERSPQSSYFNYPDIISFSAGASQDRGFPRSGNTLYASPNNAIIPTTTFVQDTIIRRDLTITQIGPAVLELFTTPSSTDFVAVIDITAVTKNGTSKGATCSQVVSMKVAGTSSWHRTAGDPGLEPGWTFSNPAGSGRITVTDTTTDIERVFVISVRFSSNNSAVRFSR